MDELFSTVSKNNNSLSFDDEICDAYLELETNNCDEQDESDDVLEYERDHLSNIARDKASAPELKKMREPKGPYSRKKYVDQKKLDKKRDELLNGKQTTSDPYEENNVLHKNGEAAKNKYGEKNKTKHTLNIDHTLPADKLYKELKSNPFLSEDDIRDIINNDANLSAMSEKMNKSKGARSNKEQASRRDKNYSDDTKKNLEERQKKAAKETSKMVANKTVKNMAKIGLDGAKNAAIGQTITSTLEHGKNVIKGEEEIDDAIINGGIEVAKASGKDFVNQIVVHGVSGKVSQKIEEKAVGKTVEKVLIEKGIKKEVAKKTGETLCTEIAGGAIKVVELVERVGVTTARYFNGELDGEEYVLELGKTGTEIAASFVGEVIGGVAGGVAGASIGGVFGGPAGAAMGAKIGQVIGEIVGSFVGYFIGSAVYNAVFKNAYERHARINKLKEYQKILEKIEKQLEEYRLELQKNIQLANLELDIQIQNAIESIDVGIKSQNLNKVNKGLGIIATEFRLDVSFKTREEFDDFMLDDDLSITLGNV